MTRTFSTRVNQMIEWFFINITPTFFFLAVLGNIILEGRSCSLRASFFIITFLLTLWSPQWTLRLLLVSLPWFEIPTLKMGFQNQFIIEVAIIGFLFSFFIYRKIHRLNDTYKEKILHRFVYHPFFLPLLSAIVFGFISFCIQVGELYALGGFKLYKVVGLYLRNFLDWNIESDPFIGLSLVSSYLLHITFLFQIFSFKNILDISKKNILMCLAVGALGVFLYAYLQVFFPDFVSSVYTVDIGGTFQNGNLLSFYVVLCFYIAIELLFFSKLQVIMSLTLLLTSFVPFLVGKGKTAWFASALSLVLVLPLLLGSYFSSLKNKQKKYVSYFLICVFIFGSACFFSFKDSSHFIELKNASFSYFEKIPKFMEIKSELVMGENTFILAWQQSDISILLNSFGRSGHMTRALEYIEEKPFLGHGLGTFFRRAGVNLDLHNSYLEWFYSMGVGEFFIVILAMILFSYYLLLNLKAMKQAEIERSFFSLSPSRALFRRRLSSISTLWFAITLFLCFFMDHYLSYRPLAYIVSILLSVIVFEGSREIRKNRLNVFLPFLVMCFAFCCGFSTILNPQTAIMLPYDNGVEKDAQGDFSWVSLFFEDTIPPRHCFEAEISPYFSAKNFYILAGALREFHPFHGSFSDLIRREGNYVTPLKAMYMENEVWTKICACNVSKEKSEIFYMRGNQTFLSSLASKIKDDRLLSFRLRKKNMIASEKFLEKNAKDFWLSCQELLFLGH